MKRFPLVLLMLTSIAALSACSDDPVGPPPDDEAFTTFDTGLEGWIPLDLGLAAGTDFSVVQESGTARFDFDAVGAGGEGVIAREFSLRPETEYTLLLAFLLETSDTLDVVEPWDLVVGTSVGGGAWVLNDDLTTATPGPVAAAYPIQGTLEVTTGPGTGSDDTTSEVRVAIGFRPLTAAGRTYRVDNVVAQFFRAGSN